MVRQFMRQHRGRHSIREMATQFGVSSSAYYRWAKEGVSERRREADAELAELIRRIQAAHHYRYDSPRVREALRRDYDSGQASRKWPN
jgi:transposase